MYYQNVREIKIELSIKADNALDANQNLSLPTTQDMLNLYFKWRYERRARAGAFKLPKQSSQSRESSESPTENTHFGSYLAQTAARGRSFRRYDLPRRGRKLIQFVAMLAIICFVAWVTYESINAIALLGN